MEALNEEHYRKQLKFYNKDADKKKEEEGLFDDFNTTTKAETTKQEKVKAVSFVMPEFTSKSSSNHITHTSSISSISSSSTKPTATTTKVLVASAKLDDMKKRVEMLKKRKANEEESYLFINN